MPDFVPTAVPALWGTLAFFSATSDRLFKLKVQIKSLETLFSLGTDLIFVYCFPIKEKASTTKSRKLSSKADPT